MLNVDKSLLARGPTGLALCFLAGWPAGEECIGAKPLLFVLMCAVISYRVWPSTHDVAGSVLIEQHVYET